jgi:hypothetical protein
LTVKTPRGSNGKMKTEVYASGPIPSVPMKDYGNADPESCDVESAENAGTLLGRAGDN